MIQGLWNKPFHSVEQGLEVFQHTVETLFTKGSNENEYEDFQPENHVPKMESRALFNCGGLPPFKNSSLYTGPGPWRKASLWSLWRAKKATWFHLLVLQRNKNVWP